MRSYQELQAELNKVKAVTDAAGATAAGHTAEEWRQSYGVLKNAYDELNQEKARSKWGQTDAPRVLVACIGSKFMDGCKESIIKAAEVYAEKAKGTCDVFIQASLTVLPPLGLGAMRNFMVERAGVQGYDYLLLMDNDVRLDDPETILKLVARGKPYITPWFDQSTLGTTHRIADPMFTPKQGILRLSWTTPYCNLIACSVFRLTGYRPFTDSMIYCEDEYNSLHFRCYGVTIWQDTDLAVSLLRGPRLLCDTMAGLKVMKPGEQP